MSTKTSRPCRANNPKTCPHHGAPSELNQATALQNKIQAVLATPNQLNPRLLASSQLIDNAANSSLKWEGEQPTWWAEYKHDSENHKLVPTTTELIDIIDSPEGKLAVVWQNESQRDIDLGVSLGSGYGTRICYFKSVETGKTLGFVNMAYMDKSTVERTFGNDEMTPYRWHSRYEGTRYPFKKDNYIYEDRDLKGEALREQRRKVWVLAARDARRTIRDADGDYVSYYDINESHIPDDATVEKDLKEFSIPIKKAMRASRSYYSTPYVDYSEVEKPLKGQGYGTALYVYTARMLAKEGKALRGSGLQSDDAQKVWGRSKEKFPNNVSSINQNYKGLKSQAPLFDFREKG